MKISVQEAINQPEQYFSKFDQVFYKLAAQFIPSMMFESGEKVLDVGCRHGKVSALLASLNPDVDFKAVTTTTGFQSCIEKVDMLSTLSNLKFDKQVLQNYAEKSSFDKIVSFNCLNWIEDRQSVVETMYQALKPGGTAYLQFFVDHGRDWFDQCIYDVATLPEWQIYVKDFTRKIPQIKPGDFLAIAEKIGFVLEKGEVVRRSVLIKNEEYFRHWLMTWNAHSTALPLEKVDLFFDTAIENYLKKEPKNALGQIFYRDYFFEVALSKPNRF